MHYSLHAHRRSLPCRGRREERGRRGRSHVLAATAAAAPTCAPSSHAGPRSSSRGSRPPPARGSGRQRSSTRTRSTHASPQRPRSSSRGEPASHGRAPAQLQWRPAVELPRRPMVELAPARRTSPPLGREGRGRERRGSGAVAGGELHCGRRRWEEGRGDVRIREGA